MAGTTESSFQTILEGILFPVTSVSTMLSTTSLQIDTGLASFWKKTLGVSRSVGSLRDALVNSLRNLSELSISRQLSKLRRGRELFLIEIT